MNLLTKIAIPVAAAALIAACGNSPSATPTPQGSGSAAAANTSSPAYKMGLDSGTSGLAEIEAFKGTSDNDACKMSFDIDQNPSADLSQQDYMAGCLYGLSHQSAQWTQTRQ